MDLFHHPPLAIPFRFPLCLSLGGLATLREAKGKPKEVQSSGAAPKSMVPGDLHPPPEKDRADLLDWLHSIAA